MVFVLAERLTIRVVLGLMNYLEVDVVGLNLLYGVPTVSDFSEHLNFPFPPLAFLSPSNLTAKFNYHTGNRNGEILHFLGSVSLGWVVGVSRDDRQRAVLAQLDLL